MLPLPIALPRRPAVQLVPSSPAKAAAAVQPQRAVFDAPKDEDIYANPPSILSTLQDQLQSDINDPALRCARVDPACTYQHAANQPPLDRALTCFPKPWQQYRNSITHALATLTHFFMCVFLQQCCRLS